MNENFGQVLYVNVVFDYCYLCKFLLTESILSCKTMLLSSYFHSG